MAANRRSDLADAGTLLPDDSGHFIMPDSLMETLAAGMSFVDLRFQGTPRVIATAVLQGPSGVALLDPGPTSTWPTLGQELRRSGIAVGDLAALVLTHIHLDHAGVAGTLVRENPRLRVY